MNLNKSVQKSVRLSETDTKQITECVNNGAALNEADFIRQAIREKINRCAA